MTLYPKAMSRIIIMTKPTMRPRVATSVLPFVCESGINSSTTTKIIAPAAKERAYGRMAVIDKTATAPSRAPTGSTMADMDRIPNKRH